MRHLLRSHRGPLVGLTLAALILSLAALAHGDTEAAVIAWALPAAAIAGLAWQAHEEP